MALTRRDFNRLTASAFGGVLAGAAAGCGSGSGKGENGSTSNETGNTEVDDSPAGDDSPVAGDQEPAGAELAEHNACLGLNQCKDYGKNPGEHECAGQAECATVSHSCEGQNDCKFLGACNGKVGTNQCRGKGGCQVPMEPGDDLWKEARAAFEKRMKAKETPVGKAPLS